MDKIEVLARAWIDCDPNRMGAEPGSGFHPDDIMGEATAGDMKNGVTRRWSTDFTGKPHWHWFIPRAEFLERYLDERGWVIAPKDEDEWEVLAEGYKAISGKSIHASDCATSCAPARKPGPCNCSAVPEGHAPNG